MNPEKPRLVIIVPTKNRRVLLERALESVRTQNYQHYRIVIINDGSTDGTREYLEMLQEKFPGELQCIHHTKSRGVNAARNAAFKTLQEGEWAVQLDDDDLLLPHALDTIANGISEAPDHIQLLCFRARTRTPTGEYVSGLRFKEGQEFVDPSYEDFMEGLDAEGDMRAVFKWTLFPKYLFREDINGYEGEWWLWIAHEGVGIRYLSGQTTLIDQAHGGEQLSMVASRRNPASFMRAYQRMFVVHRNFYATHPERSLPAAVSAFKLSVRAFSLLSALYFALLALRDYLKILFRRKRMEEKP